MSGRLPDSASVGVVGAGITGLALTHALDDDSVVTVEAAPEPGGVIRSERVDGTVLDLGPQRTRLSGAVRDLVDSLGLSNQVVAAPEDLPLYVLYGGRLHRAPLSPRAAVETGLLSVRGKLRLLLEPLTGPPREGESVAAFLRRTLGTEAADRLAAPLYAGLYGSDPTEMPVEHSLGRALDEAGVGRSLLVGGARKLLSMRLRGRERPPAVTFEEGMAALPRALYRTHEERIHCSTPVEGIEREGDRYRLETDRGSVAVDDVVLTTPAGETADLLREVAPEPADRLDRLSYNPLAVVHLDADLDTEGTGFLVADEEDTPLLGSTWNTSAFDRDGVVTCYLGGADRPGLVESEDEHLGRVAAAEFQRIVGCNASPLAVHRWSRGMPAYDRSWTALDGVELPERIHLRANFHARAGIPGRVRAARSTADQLR